METFDLGKVVFVSGLHWQILSGKPAEAKAEIRQLAKQLSYDLSVHRKTGVPQVGMASKEEGCHPGMKSAAAVVSKTLELENDQRDFLCATELPDGRFLYVEQSEGVILPDGDLIGSADIIRARLLDDLSLAKAWESIIAPDAWGIERSKERIFTSFLPTKNGKPDLKHAWWDISPVELSLGASLKKFILPLAGIAIAAGCYMGFVQWKAARDAKDAERIALEAHVANQSKPPEHPWKNKPRAASFVNSCLQTFASTQTFWPGNWAPVSVICESSKGLMTVLWKRNDYGWASHLLAVVPQAVVSLDGTSATLSVPIDVTGAKEDESLISESQRAMQTNEAASALRIRFTMSAPPAPPVLPGATAGAQAIAVPWRELAWSLKSDSMQPDILIPSFDGPGFRAETVTATFSGGVITWEMGGSQYVI